MDGKLPYALILPSHKPPAVVSGKAALPLAALAEIPTVSYMSEVHKIAVILPLLAFLAASVWFIYYVWATDEGPPMPASGYVAMAIGVLFSLVIGIGLMALIFYSHRHGYDERGQGGSGDGSNG
jgi:hypothetical protein